MRRPSEAIFFFADIHAGTLRVGGGGDAVGGQGGDNAVFEGGNDAAYGGFAPFEIDHGVDDELAGAVVGNLAATVDLHDGDAVPHQQVFGLARQALGEDGIVFHNPQFVFGVGRAAVVERLHGVENGQIVTAAEAHGFHHSTTFTKGCAVRLR